MTDTLEVGKLQNEALFQIEPVQLQFSVKSPIHKLLVKSNLLCLVLITGTIYKIDLNNPEEVIILQLPLKKDVNVINSYMDDLGNHLIIESSRNEWYYVNRLDSKFKNLSKLKGLNPTSFHFVNDLVSEKATGPILISSGDRIYEYHVDNHNESSLKQVHSFKVPTAVLSTFKEGSQYIINVITGGQFFQFRTPIMSYNHNVFNVLNKQEPVLLSKDFNIHLMTCNDTKFAYTAVSEDRSERVIFGNLNIKSSKELSTLRLKCKVRSLTISKYHIIILSSDNKLLIYNQLSHQLTQKYALDDYLDDFQNLATDPLEGTYWGTSKSKIYEIVTNDESVGVWKLLLERNRFDEALQLLNNPKDTAKRQLVLSKQGEYLFSQKKYKEAASTLGKTNNSFENISLMFLDLNDPPILREYLITKSSLLPKHFTGQKIILNTWIVESFVEELNEIDKQSMLINKAKSGDEQLQKRGQLIGEFHDFLKAHNDSLDRETVYEILISHNRQSDLLRFANEIGDYEFLLKNCIQTQNWDQALKVLLSHGDTELIYQSATALIINEPSKIVEVWIRLSDILDPLKLIPSLLIYNKNIAFVQGVEPQFNEALKYLSFLIYEKQVKDTVIHNTFYTILISYPNQEGESHILKYLTAISSNINNVGGHLNENPETNFDYDFILRQCLKFHKVQTAIKIYSLSGKYENAITLALENNLINVAILVADTPLGQYRKKLWLLIANKLIQNLVLNENFINDNEQIFNNFKAENNKPMSYLIKFLMTKCDSLTINDLLPLFPDFVIIDNFKEDIVDALTKTSRKIASMSLEMENSLEESERNKEYIKNFKADSFQIIEPYESCLSCHKLLSSRKFYVFPCFHSFHQDCLVKEILESNDYKFKNQIYKLQKKIKLNSGNSKVIKETKKEIDQVLSTACCLCTDIKINQIDEPLVKPGVKDEWAI